MSPRTRTRAGLNKGERSDAVRPPSRDHPLGLLAGRAPFLGFTGLAPGLGASALVSTAGLVGSGCCGLRLNRPPLRPAWTGFFAEPPVTGLLALPDGRAGDPVLPAICGGGNLRSTHCCWARVNRLFVTQ